MRRLANERQWRSPDENIQVNRKNLIQALEAARAYMLNHQLPAGNFNYEYDLVLRESAEDDNQVRQAGALWGLASLCRDRPTEATRKATVRGLDFFFRCSRALPTGNTAPVYPGQPAVKTGMVALTTLAIIDFMRGQDKYFTRVGRGFYDSWLSQYLVFLESMEMPNGSWSTAYLLDLEIKEPNYSPYYDGEALLAYCKAARYMGREELIPKIEAIAPKLARRYTVEVWKADRGSGDTAGFFQWGCMAFAEYCEAGWKDADYIADAAMALTWWAIHDDEVERLSGNTAYAVEGLLASYRIARLRGDEQAANKIRSVVLNILKRLMAWQVGGPFEKHNRFLKDRNVPVRAEGGVMDSKDSGIIRIDVVQHQIHAYLLALEILFPDEKATAERQKQADSR